MSHVFGEGQLGQIVYGSTRYQITWDDLLWAARMIEGESGNDMEDAANVLWAQTQRMANFHSTNFVRLIQGQSQPINPKWRADGEFCRPGGRWAADESRCGPTQLQRRQQLAEKPWEQISSARQDLVFNWATARLPNRVEKAVDFAQPGAASHHRGAAGLADRGLIYVYDKRNRGPNSIDDLGNVYYATERSNAWPPEYVKIIFNGTSSETAAPTPTTTSTVTSTAQHSTGTFDRTFRMTSNRQQAPANLYDYYTLSGSDTDPQTNNVLSENDEQLIIKTNYDRFFDQVNALKNASSLDIAQTLPLITIFGEDEDGNIVNLTEEIFSQPTFHNIFEDGNAFNTISNAEFPERPLASVESLTIDIQTPSVGGTTEITIVNLKLKIHAPSLVTTNHPKGKFISYMLRPGYNMRIRYGITSEPEFDSNAFQWKEQGFFTSQYNMTVNDDKTISLQLQLLPNMQKLMNQVLIGESIPVGDIGNITDQDINNAIDSVTTGEDLSQSQVDEVRRRIRNFANQFNSSLNTPALRTQSFSGTFGSTLQGAIRTTQIFERQGIDSTAVVLDNTTEALASIQSILLTRRFDNLLRRDAYNYHLPNSTPIYAINCGPLVYNLVRPEIEMIVQYASENNMQIGEIFSVDASLTADNLQKRNNVQFVFGNFNAQAGQFAGKPISMFPVNIESIFSYLRQVRLVGEFSNNINGFFNNIASIINNPENYNVARSDGGNVNWPLEVPQIKCLFYPDPRKERTDNWIFYIYDNKTPIVEFRSLLERLNNQELPNKQDIIEACTARKIPWIEMGSQGNFVKTMAAQTQADDLLQTHNIIQANRSARRTDASEVPSGVFADWWSSGENGTAITNQVLIIPFSVRATTFMLSTAFLFAPIYIFFPIPEYSGVFMPYILGHEIKGGAANTNMDLQINVTRSNRRET